MATNQTDLFKYKNVMALPKLQQTFNPTEVNHHMKCLVEALQKDGFRKGTLCCEPRTNPPYRRYTPPVFDPTRDCLSPEAAAHLNNEQREAAKVANVAKYENERRRLANEAAEEEKQIYHLAKHTFSAASLSKAKTLDVDAYESGEISQDTHGLVMAIVVSHSGATATGLSPFAIQELLDKRVASYHACVQGSKTLEAYLDETNDHIKAIASMDGNVLPDGTGGYLGSRDDQVMRFLRGTGATKIINMHLNGTLAADKVPRTREEVCTLLTMWKGSIYEPGDGPTAARPATSIMSNHEEDSRILTYGQTPQMPATPGAFSAEQVKKARAEKVAKRIVLNAEAVARGVVMVPKHLWKGNEGCPNPPLVRTVKPTRPNDTRPCENCGGFHYHEANDRPTSWPWCPWQWDPVCVEKNEKYKARLLAGRARGAQPKPSSTIAHAQAEAPVPPPAPTGYSAAEHAAAMAVRAAVGGGTVDHSIRHTNAQYVSPWSQQQPMQHGWTLPWDGPESSNIRMVTTLPPGTPEHPIERARPPSAIRTSLSLLKMRGAERTDPRPAWFPAEKFHQPPNHFLATWLGWSAGELHISNIEKYVCGVKGEDSRPRWYAGRLPPNGVAAARNATPDVMERLSQDPERTKDLSNIFLRKFLVGEVRHFGECHSDIKDRMGRLRAPAPDHEPHGRPPVAIMLSKANVQLSKGVKGVAYKLIPPESNHVDPGHTPGDEACWHFDSGAGVAGFKDTYGLSAVMRLDRPVVIGGIVDGANLTVTQGAMLDNVKVLVHPSFTANCLPSSTIVDADWLVRYDHATDSYVVRTASGCILCFERYIMANGAVTTHYLCHPGLPYTGPDPSKVLGPNAIVLSTSVKGNMAMHSPQDAKAAEIAHKYLTNMGGSLAHGVERLPGLKGANITADHVRKAAHIYGPVRGHAQGSATAVQDVAIVTELPSTRPEPVPLSLSLDLFKILGSWFIVGVFLPCHYVSVVNVADHSAPAILAAVKTMVQSAGKRNFDVLKIQADGERGIHSAPMDEYCAAQHILLQATGAGQHEASAERFIRTVKTEVRNIAARIVPNALPRNLLVHLVIAATVCINCRLTTALDGSLSPYQLWTGDTQQHAQDLDFGYGDLALAKTPNNTNDVAPRADTVMVLYPVFNGLHGYLVYKIGTGAIVVRNHNTLRAIPWNESDVAHFDRMGKDDPDGVVLPRREAGADSSGLGVQLGDPNPTSLITGGDAPSQMQREAATDLGTLVEPWSHDHPEVGQRVAKVFKGTTFFGTIDKVLPEHVDSVGDTVEELYHVAYDDGDEEEMSAGDLARAKELRASVAPPPVGKPRRTGVRAAIMNGSWLHNIPVVTIHRISVSKAMKEHPVETDKAVRAELQQMLNLKVFRPQHVRDLTVEERSKSIRSSIFIKHKYSPSGAYTKTKARLVAGGDGQDKSLYENISSPTATPTSVLFVCGDAAAKGKAVASMDIGAAYLNASMASTGVQVNMFIEPRLGKILAELDPTYLPYLTQSGSVCVRLEKALYGTVEASRLWYDLITKVLVEDEFIPNPYEKCVLNKTTKGGAVITVVLYVDDLLVTCASADAIAQLKNYLLDKFSEVSFHTGKVIEYVGMTIDFESKPGCAVVTMKQMTDDIINTSGTTAMHPTPANEDLFEIDEASLKLDQIEESFYRTFVAKLLYLCKRVRPDLLCPVAFLTTRAIACTKQDLVKLHRVIGHLRATPERGIVIQFGSDPRAQGYIDASYAIHQRDGKSHTGASLIFGKGGPLYVTSVKQTIVTKSSTEAELVAFSDVASEVIALRHFSIGQGYSDAPAIIHQDNLSTMALVTNGGPCSKRSRHVDIRRFWMAERVSEGVLKVVKCPTAVMWANLLTKPVVGKQFIDERNGLTNWE